MSIISNLKVFTPTTKGCHVNPVKHRRYVFCDSLKKQIRLIDGDEIKGRKWWTDYGDEVTSCLRYSADALDLGNGTHFSVSSLDELKEVYSELIEEVTQGGFDELLEKHWEKSSFNHKNQKVS
jgi:hypothetical protein